MNPLDLFILNKFQKLTLFHVEKIILFKKMFFNNGAIRCFGIVMNENSAFTGDKTENRFRFQKFGLREICSVRGNQTIVDMNCVNIFRPWITTMEALNLKEDGHNVELEEYQNHCLFSLIWNQRRNLMLI